MKVLRMAKMIHAGEQNPAEGFTVGRAEPDLNFRIRKADDEIRQTLGPCSKWSARVSCVQFFNLSETPCAARVSLTPCCVPCSFSTTPCSFFMITSLWPPARAIPASPAA